MSHQKKLRIRTSDIPTSWFNARCRNLISKYALLAFNDDGTIFDMRCESIMVQLSQHSKFTSSRELLDIYHELKVELQRIVSSPSLKTALNILAEKLNYLEGDTIH